MNLPKLVNFGDTQGEWWTGKETNPYESAVPERPPTNPGYEIKMAVTPGSSPNMMN